MLSGTSQPLGSVKLCLNSLVLPPCMEEGVDSVVQGNRVGEGGILKQTDHRRSDPKKSLHLYYFVSSFSRNTWIFPSQCITLLNSSQETHPHSSQCPGQMLPSVKPSGRIACFSLFIPERIIFRYST